LERSGVENSVPNCRGRGGRQALLVGRRIGKRANHGTEIDGFHLSGNALIFLPMCGRFSSTLSAELVRRLFSTEGDLPYLVPSWNLAPSQYAMVVRRHPETGIRRLDTLRWGLVPFFTKDWKATTRPINARAESIATSGMFRGAFAARRCIVPADLFYEWRKVGADKEPYAIARADEAPSPSAASGRAGDHRMVKCCALSRSSPRQPTAR
jgi:hypothetical protein